MANIFEPIVVDGLELHHTFRGHYKEVEVYTYQSGPKTYSLYKPKANNTWRADWATSYQIKDISLDANSSDQDAMLKAFVAAIKEMETESH